MPDIVYPSVVLASSSSARAALLQGAGVVFEIEPAAVDEAEVKRSLLAEGAGAADIAKCLAELKGCRISQRRPGELCIGADQTLECDGIMLDKPPTMVQAKTQLERLRNRKHVLFDHVVVALDGAVIWRHAEHAELWMRDFTDSFLENYLDECGPEVLSSVGGYRLEGLGVQLFSRINGEYSAILGLPLLPLLSFLRARGVLQE